MARKPKRTYAETQPSVDDGSNVMALTKELWQTARAAVKRVLRRRDVREEDFDPFLDHIIQQAEALYAD